tara:strand:+ start:23 stop:205 length:183 start_codon:yes stop_codon:yes gene_type:complete
MEAIPEALEVLEALLVPQARVVPQALEVLLEHQALSVLQSPEIQILPIPMLVQETEQSHD